jgi:hypothetical protein
MSPEVQNMLADTLKTILTIAKYELTGEALPNYERAHEDYIFQTNGFAFDLPNMMLQYGFVTLEELNEPPILEYVITIPTMESADGDDARVANQNQPGDRRSNSGSPEGTGGDEV